MRRVIIRFAGAKARTFKNSLHKTQRISMAGSREQYLP